MRKVNSLLSDSKFVVGFLAIGVTVLLAVFSFALSYFALRELARASGAVVNGLDVLWPLVVDFGLIVFGLVSLYKTMCGQRALTQRLLVLLFSAMSVFFNVAHSPAVLVSRLVAACPPVALVLALESLLEMISNAVGESPEAKLLAQNAKDLAEQDAQITELAKLLRDAQDASATQSANAMQGATQTQVMQAQRKPQGRNASASYAAFKIAQLGRNGDGAMQAQEIAQAFGVSLRTAQYWQAQLRQELAEVGNGAASL